MISVSFFILGTIIGSFLSVCICRIPAGESIVYPPSHCSNCKSNIKPYDLIPIVSYVILRGKCRYCKEKISIKSPLMELFTGIMFLSLYLKYGLTLDLIKYLILFSFLIVIGCIDYNTTDVYFSTTSTGIGIGILFLVINWYLKLPVRTYFLGAIIGGIFILLIAVLTGGMGFGDVEICILSGIYIGTKLTVLMLFLSFILGGAVGAVLIISKKKSRKDYIPFGPYISIATMIAVLFGEKIINWYLY
ncbi:MULTISPECIES: prepilin peptidase [Clostridium]|uniref:prepilin peptidase n=1 Tax=Clostridium TaxID=1485 RepID=UPI0004D3588B|nr:MULTISPECIES: A24 family peptidase [Clostridium]KEH86178.1 peptidase A24 [Clostridium novyi A str. 4540]KEH86821.1 peptidase A24 [Clostridium novyi A str. BKT29909]KEH92174.1 peptidase A24 [Clostridium novyi A str. GD211209]KEH92236.1 peptidase A24 [Clostridium botulinum C/D str. It1]